MMLEKEGTLALDHCGPAVSALDCLPLTSMGDKLLSQGRFSYQLISTILTILMAHAHVVLCQG